MEPRRRTAATGATFRAPKNLRHLATLLLRRRLVRRRRRDTTSPRASARANGHARWSSPTARTARSRSSWITSPEPGRHIGRVGDLERPVRALTGTFTRWHSTGNVACERSTCGVRAPARRHAVPHIARRCTSLRRSSSATAPTSRTSASRRC